MRYPTTYYIFLENKNNIGPKYHDKYEHKKIQGNNMWKMAKISRTFIFYTIKFSTFFEFLVVFVVSPTTHEIVLNLISPVGG